jgi:hypothetical protein
MLHLSLLLACYETGRLKSLDAGRIDEAQSLGLAELQAEVDLCRKNGKHCGAQTRAS